MLITFSTHNFHSICDKLAARDNDLSNIIKTYGYPPMWTRSNSFETLVHIILEQQVSLASGLAALKQLKEKTGGITPAKILALNEQELRAAYVSRQKTIYIKTLARAIEENYINLHEMEKVPDEDVRTILTALKGIGNWTADIYLMFVLRRTDIFPMGDLAAVNSLKRVKDLAKEVAKEDLAQITENWSPYRTIATMVLWHHYLSSPKQAKQVLKTG